MITTQEHALRRRGARDSALEPCRAWLPRDKRLELLGGGPCGSFAARGGAPDDQWQPTSVTGFVLDLDPRFGVTLDSSLGSPHVAQITNRAPGSASDAFANSNTSLQPAYEATGWIGPFARPSMLFDGVGHYLICTTSLASTLAGGSDTPFTLFLVAQNLTLSGIRCFTGFFRSSSTAPLMDLFTSGGLYRVNRRDDSATSQNVTGGTPDTSKHIFELIHTGTTTTVKVDGIAAINAAAQDVGAITFDRMAIGSTYANSSPGDWANMRLARLLGFTGALGTTDADYVRAQLTALYF